MYNFIKICPLMCAIDTLSNGFLTRSLLYSFPNNLKFIIQIHINLYYHLSFPKNQKKNYSTKYSRVVSNHSTDLAISSLTLEIGRDPVLSTMYGRSWKCFSSCVLSVTALESVSMLVWYVNDIVLRWELDQHDPNQL